MNYLADTHLFLWTIFSPKKISKRVRNIANDLEAIKYISIITLWEISLKFSTGRIDLGKILPDDLPNIAKDTGFEILGLDTDTVTSFYKLPKLKNKDPFDRMLAWQAISGNFILLTKDTGFESYIRYGLKTDW